MRERIGIVIENLGLAILRLADRVRGVPHAPGGWWSLGGPAFPDWMPEYYRSVLGSPITTRLSNGTYEHSWSTHEPENVSDFDTAVIGYAKDQEEEDV
jgi:hypothetical protein